MTVKKKRTKRFVRNTIIIFLLSFLSIGLYLGYQINRRVSHIMDWSSEIEKISTNYQMEDYQPLIKAIILAESKGNKIDLMQSSESRYGTVGEIASEKESLEAGIAFLSESIKLGKDENVDIWTSVQAYNFGLNYIYYVSERGGKNTIQLAETYSKEVLAPTLGNKELTTYSYKLPQAIIYNGGQLYQNGGNFFYAEVVKWYLKIINWFT